MLSPQTYEGFHLQPREHPFNLDVRKPTHRCYAEVDFCKHYRHCLMYPGYGWAVYSPTDSFVQGDTEAHWCFVDNGPCLLYTSPSPRDRQKSRMPCSA